MGKTIGLAWLGGMTLLLLTSARVSAEGPSATTPVPGCGKEIQELEQDSDKQNAGLRARMIAEQHSEQGQFECSIKLLEVSISLLGPDNPVSFASHQRLAEAYEHAGTQLEAERTWLSLVDRFPGDTDYDRDGRAEMLVNLGEYYQRQGRDTAAERTYQGAVETLGSNGSGLLRERALRALMRLYESQGRFSSAADTAGQLIAAIEVKEDETPEAADILVAALDEQARLLERAGRQEEADQARARSRALRSQL